MLLVAQIHSAILVGTAAPVTSIVALILRDIQRSFQGFVQQRNESWTAYGFLTSRRRPTNNSLGHSLREMAGAQETVEYLLESQHFFGDKIPPFTRRGWPKKRKIDISVRLRHNGRLETVKYRRYRSTDNNYATIRLDGLIYNVMALPKDWKRGDCTDSHGGCRSWFAWQGPRQQFLGQRFQGPVAVSKSISGRSRDIRPASLSRNGLSASHAVIKSNTSSIQGSLGLSPPPSEMGSSSTSSEYLPASKFIIEPQPAEGYAVSTRRTTRSSNRDPHEVLSSNSDDTSQTLTQEEEAAIWMRICVPGEEDRFRPMFLSSARPSSELHGLVTHRSLFEKAARVCNLGKAEIQQLEVKIDERHIMKVMQSRDTVTVNQVSFQIGREEEESWHLCVICLKELSVSKT